MARTTLDLDPSVLDELRRRSRHEGKSMGQVASELLTLSVSEAAPTERPPFSWTARDLGQPLVDPEDKEAVRAITQASSRGRSLPRRR
jgi:hypothetical protein